MRPARGPISPARSPAIDGLRLVAAALVVTYHVSRPSVPYGWLGVDVFFVISGYVITGLLKAEWDTCGSINYRRFYLNRLARLWPALLAMLAAAAVVGVFISHWRAEYSQFTPIAFYMTDFELGLMPGEGGLWMFQHTWSLAVEFHFYLLWPALFVFAMRRRYWVRWAVVGAGVTWAIATRVLVYGDEAGWVYMFHMPDARLDELFIGCGLALWAPNVRRRIAAVLGPTCLALLALIAFGRLRFPDDHALGTWAMTAIALLSAGLIASLTASGTSLSAALGRLSWPGRNLSYGIYLWHYPTLQVLRDRGVSASVALWGTVFVAVAASLAMLPVERRVRRWVSGSVVPVVS